MSSDDIRSEFLEFFRTKGHKILPSAPIVNTEDTDLMFVNAGMNQFKGYFLGYSDSSYKRIANSQRCLRVSGKHNDLEAVGTDNYHHTMFEMLGNWSFGDYFKEECIEWAWELLTEVYNIDKERLYITVFSGDNDLNLGKDEDSIRIWKKYVSEDKIVLGNVKDNFWEMGSSGPCGYCSEIHLDMRDKDERSKVAGRSCINKNHPLVIEIWNLVFIQYNKTSSGQLIPLKKNYIDTGMGIERLTMALQNKKSSYETDIFSPIIDSILQHSNVSIDKKTTIASQVIADHLRAIVFTIIDGQIPSSTKAGYVVRRLIRRAIRYGYSFLEFRNPFLFDLVKVVVEKYKDVFPEVNNNLSFLQKNTLPRRNWVLEKNR